jgi:hypothetical protein
LTLHMGLWAFSPIFSVVKYFSIWQIYLGITLLVFWII